MGVTLARSFIIIEPDPIVCLDMEGMLTTRYPQSDVIAGASLSDIGHAIHTCGPDSTLFIKSALFSEDEALLRVTRSAVTRGGQVVIIGHSVEVDFAATFVELPFTTGMIMAALDRDTPDSTVGPAV